MFHKFSLAVILFAVASATATVSAQESHGGRLDALIASHAAANHVPETLVRRVIHRESRGNPRAVSKGNYGLMQIRLGTARAMGYRGGTAGLLDANTNMTYAVKYLAGAYRTAGGNHDRAVRYYAAGYYYAAKRKGLLDKRAPNPIGAFASAVASGGATTAARTKSVKHASNPVALKDKVREARKTDSGAASSSDLYTGKIDYF